MNWYRYICEDLEKKKKKKTEESSILWYGKSPGHTVN